MKSDTRRTALLVSLVVIVGALVVLDRLSGDARAERDDPRAAYLNHAELVAHMERAIEDEDLWLEAHAQTRDRWRAERGRMISATTAEVANARLQQRINAIVTDLGVTLDATSTSSVRTPLENEPIRIISLTLSVRTPSPQSLYALIDRLENMSDVRTNIRRVQTLGPRRTPASRLDVQIDLEALAWIGPELSDE